MHTHEHIKKPQIVGATAGGAYLLSAKQRYNERVKTSIKGLLQTEESLKNGDSKSANAYFDGEDAGSWKDLTAAGYLLSNAFRRTSTTPPDSLPSVKVRDCCISSPGWSEGVSYRRCVECVWKNMYGLKGLDGTELTNLRLRSFVIPHPPQPFFVRRRNTKPSLLK